MRAYLITIEAGEIVLYCFARLPMILALGEEIWSMRRSITEIAATLKQLEEELYEQASAVTVADDRKQDPCPT